MAKVDFVTRDDRGLMPMILTGHERVA